MILGIDPGKNKTGWALVCSTGELILSGMFCVCELNAFLKVFEYPVENWEERLFFCTYEKQPVELETRVPALDYVALGNGTGSREVAFQLGQSGLKTVLVDEKGTTLVARKLYWRIHRPAFWQMCLPYSLRVPPRVLDDLAAWAIALRSIERQNFAESELGRLVNSF